MLQNLMIGWPRAQVRGQLPLEKKYFKFAQGVSQRTSLTSNG